MTHARDVIARDQIAELVDRALTALDTLAAANPPGLDGAITASGSSGSSTGTSTATTNMTLRTLRNLTQSDVLLENLPSLYYRLLKTDTNTRTLANPQLRTSDGTPASAASTGSRSAPARTCR